MAWVRWFSCALVTALAACSGRSIRDVSDDDTGGGGETSGTGGSAPLGGSPAGGTAAGGSSTGGTTTGKGGAPATGGSPATGGVTSTGGAGAKGGESGAAGQPECAAQDVVAVGSCRLYLGVFFDGDSCVSLGGCSCEGADCNDPYASIPDCEADRSGCILDCAPLDAQFVGDCESAGSFVFTGVGCVQMSGCSCIGTDCASVAAPPPSADARVANACSAEFRQCLAAEKSCEEITSLYRAYTARGACANDDDCQVVAGSCAVGLGGCYYAINARWPASGLDVLTERWQVAGCTGAVCSCTAPPTGASCVNGVCTLVP